MKRISKRVGRFALALAVGLSMLELGASIVPGVSGPASEAWAVVGRPLTPVSVAAVSRRTSRRCEADIYDC